MTADAGGLQMSADPAVVLIPDVIVAVAFLVDYSGCVPAHDHVAIDLAIIVLHVPPVGPVTRGTGAETIVRSASGPKSVIGTVGLSWCFSS